MERLLQDWMGRTSGKPVVEAAGIETYVILALAGVVAGATNAVAGGGTFFTFPVLIWAGLPPLIANTTNMVALTPANLAALPAFRPQLRRLGRRCFVPIGIGVVGGTLGALLLLYLGAGIFASAVPYLIGFATLLFATAPNVRRLVLRIWGEGNGGWTLAPIVLLFVFSLYGGYFGAGLGQIVLAALILCGFVDLQEANALKNAVVFAVSIMAVLIFGLSGSVSWPFAIVMMISSSIGGYFGGSLSLMVPQRVLRAGIITFGVFLTGYYFWQGA